MHILFAGGGTAGHINPALAIAGYFKEQDESVKISYIGTANKLEAQLVPAAGYDFYTIDIAGFRRSFKPKAIAHNIVTVKKAITASMTAKKLLKKLSPDLVIGTGGYVSGPVLREAAKLHIKTAIHEQNAFPGVTTKMLAPQVDLVMLAMPEARKYLNVKSEPIVTGNPVRGAFLKLDRATSRKALSIDDRPMVLSFGGSLGARPLNEAVAEFIAKTYQSAEYIYYHATGKSGYEPFLKLLKERGVDPNAENLHITEYINNMSDCMAAADVIVGRAGAITLTEIEAAGRASVLIPSPYVAENHQYHNAMTLKNHGAAEVIEEKDLSGDVLTNALLELLKNPKMAASMGENAAKMAITDANSRIYNSLMTLYHR